MLGIGFITSIVGLWLILPISENGGGVGIPKEIGILLVMLSTVMLLKRLPGTIGQSLKRQYRIFNNKHTWIMSLLYVMTFGSFIGFAAAFPLMIQVIFGYSHIVSEGLISHVTPNPNGPSALTYAWIAPFIGSLIRPFGSWLADKIGGAFVTQICSLTMVMFTLGTAYYMQQAYQSVTPEEYFVPFFLMFLGLFTACGIGNGSTFRSITLVFPTEQVRPVLGWVSAVAAYGGFYIPMVLGEQIKITSPATAMLGFAMFYSLCLLINWFFYLRKNGELYNP